jgi:hypothetical protein
MIYCIQIKQLRRAKRRSSSVPQRGTVAHYVFYNGRNNAVCHADGKPEGQPCRPRAFNYR